VQLLFVHVQLAVLSQVSEHEVHFTEQLEPPSQTTFARSPASI
jgi:hypothetical protein